MSDHHGTSDRKAAFTGLILGVIFLVIVIVTISKLTSRKFDRSEGGAKSTASAVR